MTNDSGRGASPRRAFRPVRGMRASEEIAGQILEVFFAGMRPGDWLGTETELASRFGVSRITVRDAVRALEARGVLDVRVGARGGLRIAHSDADRFAEALRIQAHLMGAGEAELAEAVREIEPAAASLAASRAGSAQLDRMRQLLVLADRAGADLERRSALAGSFHLTIAEAAGNRMLAAALGALRATLGGSCGRYAPALPSREVNGAHREIMAAIEARDPILAGERMRAHLVEAAPEADPVPSKLHTADQAAG